MPDGLKFFKMFLEKQSQERLRIPPAYRKHIRGRIPRIIHLSGPSGDTWQVTLTRAEDEQYFEHGWPTFVRDHAIENGELLVFRCLGESKFNVEIFSRNGCPKESAFGAKRPQGPQEAKKCKKRRAVVSGHRPNEVGGSSFDQNPRFTTTINKSHLRLHYLNIPMQFARSKNLLHKCFVVLRDPMGTKWPVALRLRDCPTSLNMYHGWRNFSDANNLKVGDICVFELLMDEVESDRFSMAVHINKVPESM